MTEQYEVEKILGRRTGKNGKIEYKIKWLNYPETQCTWEPESNLTSCEQMLRKYNQSKTNKTAAEPKIKQAGPNLKINPIAPKPVLNQKAKSVQKPKMRRQQTRQDESEEQLQKHDKEEQEEQDQQASKQIYNKYKRPMSNLKQPSYKKISKNKMLPIRRHSNYMDQEQLEEEETEGNQNIAPRTNGSKLGQTPSQDIVIQKMLRGLDGMFYYKIIQKEKQSCLSRDQVLKKSMLALIVFYEKHLKFNK